MKLKHIMALAALLPLPALAQTITFDTEDYASLGVYDTWEASPFRTGALQGNYAVIDNHLNQVEEIFGEAPNPSAKILAVQRSRFGSNTFGVRVNLKETFELTPTPIAATPDAPSTALFRKSRLDSLLLMFSSSLVG